MAQDYRPDIDGLRAVSILAVALHHVRLPGFATGYLGVDVFFVISGFLITGQLLREMEVAGAIRMASFYARRARRLLPAFGAMAIGATILAMLFLLPIPEQRLFGNALTRSAAFYYNIALWRGAYEYSAPDAQQQILMHTWSLGVEEQFYLVWPWICLAAMKVGRPRTVFGVLVLASFVGTWWLLPRDSSATFFLLPFRIWELGLGACVASRLWPTSNRYAGVVAASGLALVGTALLSDQSPGSSIWLATLAALGTAAVTAFGAAPNPGSLLLCARPMVLLGRLSYAWYLWHWPFLTVARLTTVTEDPVVQVGALGLSFFVSGLTYHFIELPTRRIPIRSPGKALFWAFGALSAVALMGRVIELHSQTLMAEPENAAQLRRFKGALPAPCESQFSSLGCDLSAGSGAGDSGILLWGDSFARSLSPALVKYSQGSGSSLHLVVQQSCPPLLGVVPARSALSPIPNHICQEALQSLAERIPQDRSRLSGVVLAARWSGYVSGDVSRDPPKMYEWDGREIEGSLGLSRGLGATLDLMEELGLRVLIVGVPPSFPFDVPTCLLRDPARCRVFRTWNQSARELSRASIQRVVRGRLHVRFVEIFDTLCSGESCEAGTLREPLLADRSHLTEMAAQNRVFPILSPYLDWLRRGDSTSFSGRPNRLQRFD